LIPLIVDLETEWRGGQSQVLLLLQGLYEHGHAAELVATHGSSLSHRAKKHGIYVHSVPRSALRWRAAMIIRSILADGRVDIVHVNEAHALTAAWFASAHRRAPVLCSRRIGFPLQKNWISKARYRSVERFIANSQTVAQSLIESGISNDRISIVNEGVEIPGPISPENRNAARQKWKLGENDFVFGCASAFVTEKGQRHLVEAMPEVLKQFPNARLLLAGKGRTRSDVEELTAELGLSKSVTIPGFVSNMQDFYSVLDAFVFPSEFEGLGTALQAAMAYALPCVSTTRGALAEVVENERTVLVAEPEAGAFSAAMLRLLEDPALRQKLGESAREEIQRRFSAEKMVEATMAVYEQVMG
jgi:glycosyltransferase involved in cell wall biosynthesis